MILEKIFAKHKLFCIFGISVSLWLIGIGITIRGKGFGMSLLRVDVKDAE